MKGKKISWVLSILSMALVLVSAFLIVSSIFWRTSITGTVIGDADSGEDVPPITIPPDSPSDGAGGGGSGAVTHSVPAGGSFETPGFTVEVSGSSGIGVSDARYSSIGGLSNVISGAISFKVSSNFALGEKIVFVFTNAEDLIVNARDGSAVDFSISYSKPTTFIGVPVVPEATIEVRNPRVGDYIVSFKKSQREVFVRESVITSVDGTLFGKSITIDNDASRDYPEVLFFTVVEDTGLVTVISDGTIIDPRISALEQGKVSVSFYKNIKPGRNNINIFIVDAGRDEILITKPLFEKNEIPLVSQVPEYCISDREYTETIGDCKVAGGDTTEIITDSSNFLLDREIIRTFDGFERGCPEIVRIIESCPFKEVLVDEEPEVSLSPEDGAIVGKSISIKDENIEATIRVTEDKVDIGFGSARALEIQPSPFIDGKDGINPRFFAYGLWGLFLLILPVVFLSFRDKELSAIRSLISSSRTALRKGDRKSALEYYHLANQIYVKLPSEKKKKIADRYGEYSRMIRRG